MHELYIAESILNSTLESLPPDISPGLVQCVEVEVGALDAVVHDSLMFMFEVIKSSFGMPQTKLLLKRVEVCCICEDCTRKFQIDLPVFICPGCGGGRVKVLRGRGIKLNRIIIEDLERVYDGDSHRS
ncbi:MAG: hydrogenase maturation nickel metallochaperone HypA [FCB group bacterium]|nr:hydrogenase maturation nickel metallochaperone HypA [FCB group bacterium]